MLTVHIAFAVSGDADEASGLAIAAFVVFTLLLAVAIGLLWRLADRRRDGPAGERRPRKSPRLLEIAGLTAICAATYMLLGVSVLSGIVLAASVVFAALSGSVGRWRL